MTNMLNASAFAAEREDGIPRWQVDVLILPKQGVNDPQGEAILGGLHALTFSGVENVRAGKLIRLWLSAESADAATTEATAMCQRMLANPVVETFSIEVSPVGENER